ncbi:MAG: type VI secretion system ATPase TssH, partial [Bryobacteraceae bacterium]|nr:type VI secretion system ATPase TssH [Bryobacteraceae bacterium]
MQQALQAAQSKAVKYSHQQVDVEHVLAGLMEQEGGLALSIFLKAGISPETVHRRVMQELERLPKVSSPSGAPDQIYVTPRLNKVSSDAADEAKRLKDDYLSVEHLLLAMSDDSGFTGRLFKEVGLSKDRLISALQDVR